MQNASVNVAIGVMSVCLLKGRLKAVSQELTFTICELNGLPLSLFDELDNWYRKSNFKIRITIDKFINRTNLFYY